MVWGRDRRVILKDSTMREGLDVPGLTLDQDRKRTLLRKLSEIGVQEAEVVAPGHFERDLKSLQEMNASELVIRSSGLIYGNRPAWRDQIARANGVLDRVDILMPLAARRPPFDLKEKARLLREAVRVSADSLADVGVGFPHATQVEQEFLLEMCLEGVEAGAKRITLYDTNGSSDPWEVAGLVGTVRKVVEVEICFHAHNDLGMATANSLAAVWAGAECLDVTVNGLGDRAGNASMEQVVVALHNREVEHGLRLGLLLELSRWVVEATGMPVPKLAPIVGDFVFSHKSPSHLETPTLFEAFDPGLIGASRSICET